MNDKHPNVLADRFAIVGGAIDCFKCQHETPVAGLIVPNHQVGDEFDDGEDVVFEARHEPALLSNIRWINDEARLAIQSIAPWMSWMSSATAGEVYLGNGCIHCGALQGDWFLQKPEGPFFPMSDDAADTLSVAWQAMPLRVLANCSYSSWIDDLLERRGDYIMPIPAPKRGKRKA